MKGSNDIKIFVDAHVIDGPFQGTRTFIEGLYMEMVHLPGIQLFIAANNTEELKRVFDGDERIFYIAYKSRNRLQRILVEIPYLLKKHRIDYAHFQYITPLVNHCKTIVTTHDVIFREIPSAYSYSYKKIKTFLYKRSVKKADIVTTVSEHSRTSIEKNLKFPGRQVHIIPNGINKKYFEGLEKIKAREYIYDKYAMERFLLCVSRIEPRKNHALMLKAFLQLGLASKGYYLVFLGNKTIRVPELDRELKKLSSSESEKVMIRDDIDQEELKYFMSAATVFLYPSKGEGFGIPPLEAAALHTPVICSNAAAMSEFTFFADDHIDPLNEEGFIDRIQHILEHQPDPEILSQRSKLIEEKYTWKISAESFYQLIRSHHLNHIKS